MVYMRNDRFNNNIAVYFLELIFCRNGFWQCFLYICFIKQPLSLQIGKSNIIATNETYFPHTTATKLTRNNCSERSSTDNKHCAIGYFFLSFFTDRAKRHLPRLARLIHSLDTSLNKPFSVMI